MYKILSHTITQHNDIYRFRKYKLFLYAKHILLTSHRMDGTNFIWQHRIQFCRCSTLIVDNMQYPIAITLMQHCHIKFILYDVNSMHLALIYNNWTTAWTLVFRLWDREINIFMVATFIFLILCSSPFAISFVYINRNQIKQNRQSLSIRDYCDLNYGTLDKSALLIKRSMCTSAIKYKRFESNFLKIKKNVLSFVNLWEKS